MSLCCVTRVDERSAIKIEGYAPLTMRAKRYQNSAALLIFMRRTTIPNSSRAFIRNLWAARSEG